MKRVLSMLLRVRPTIYIGLALASYFFVWAGDFVVAVVPSHQRDFANVAERACAICLAVMFFVLSVVADYFRRKRTRNSN